MVAFTRKEEFRRAHGLDGDPVIDGIDAIFAQAEALTDPNERAIHAMRAMRLCTHSNRTEIDNRRLQKDATTDLLTGLKNRRGMMEIMERAIEDMRRHPSKAMLVALVDLDGFKAVNDSCGHHAGDDALVRVGERLESVFRKSDIICRAGGDEMVVLLPLEPGEGISKAMVKHKARKSLEGLVYWNDENQPFPVGASIGMSFIDGRVLTDDPATEIAKKAIEDADQAMYADKWYEGHEDNLEGGRADMRHPKNIRLQKARQLAIETGPDATFINN